MRLLLLVLVLCCCCLPAQASTLADFGNTALVFAKDTLLTPDLVSMDGSGDGDFQVNFSQKVTLTDWPGLSSVDFYGGLSVAMTGPALRGHVGITLTNIKGTTLMATVTTAPYEGATWRIDGNSLGRVGLEPGLALGRAF